MSKYRVTFEFDLADEKPHPEYNFNPYTWAWHELIDIDDPYTQTDFNTLRVDKV